MEEKKQIFYQKHTVTIATQNAEVDIAFDTLKDYERVKEIIIYSSTDYSSNKNLQFKQPLKIDNREIYPTNFDTALLHPRLENKEFRELSPVEEARGSRVEGKVADPNVVSSSYTLTILLVLEGKISR